METLGKFVIFKTEILALVTHRQAILLGTLNGMSKMEGYCFATNKTLSSLLHCSVDSLQRDLNALEKKELINRVITRNEKGEVINRRIYVNDTIRKSATTPTAELHITSPQNCEEGSPQDCDIYKDNTNKDNNINIMFDKLWTLYTKKGNKLKSIESFNNLKKSEISAAAEHIPKYIQNHIDNDKMEYLPHFTTYLRGKRWNDNFPYSQKSIVPDSFIIKNKATLNDD
jgi:SOS-response transcriptional repressor LexA